MGGMGETQVTIVQGRLMSTIRLITQGAIELRGKGRLIRIDRIRGVKVDFPEELIFIQGFHLFHLFIKYSLSTCCVPGTGLVIVDTR